MRARLGGLFLPWVGFLFLSGMNSAQALSPAETIAYEHNRAGMINMSMARFEEAIVEFEKAVALYPDYQIQGQPLVYTPIFMTAWAYEKIGRIDKACEFYRKFLEISPPDAVEATKAQRAREVLEGCAGK
ncbi:MAG: tetratricopeptide repeat protein [Nitrospiria bacterium]